MESESSHGFRRHIQESEGSQTARQQSAFRGTGGNPPGERVRIKVPLSVVRFPRSTSTTEIRGIVLMSDYKGFLESLDVEVYIMPVIGKVDLWSEG